MKVYEQSLDDIKYSLRIPIYVMNNPKLRDFWIKRHEELVGNMTPLHEAHFIPNNKTDAREKLEKMVREELAKMSMENIKLEGNLRGSVNKNEAYHHVLKAFTKVLNEFPEDDNLPSGYESVHTLFISVHKAHNR